MRDIKKMMAVFSVLCLVALAAEAVPVLQLYLEGATYDTASETWVLGGGATSGTSRLWVIGDVGGAGPILDVHLAVTYDTTYNPSISLTPAAPANRFGFADPSMAQDVVFAGYQTGIPVLNDGSLLPTHGVYDDDTLWQQFDLGDFTLTDSQMGDFITAFPTEFAGSTGQINVYDLLITGSGVPEDFTVHFDAYNHVVGRNHSVFVPFGHDAEIEYQPPPPVPEPAGMVILGSIGVGMFLVSRKKGRRSES